MTQRQNDLVKQALRGAELLELRALMLAADEDFDKIRPILYNLLKPLHETRHALEDLPQTSQ